MRMPEKSFQSLTVLPVAGRGLLRSICAFQEKFGCASLCWRLIRFISPAFPAWKKCPVIGPDGTPFYLDLAKSGSTQLFDGWNSAVISRVLRHLPSDAVALDIGAHIGVFTRTIAAQFSSGKVYAFEPSKESFALLKSNTENVSNIACYEVAISGMDGNVFFEQSYHSKLRHIAKQQARNTVAVSSRTLESWARDVQLSRLDFIKIDVEGFEEEALISAEQLLRKFRPTICFEFSQLLSSQRSKYRGDALFSFFKKLNYEVKRLDKSGNAHSDFGAPQAWTNDYVAQP